MTASKTSRPRAYQKFLELLRPGVCQETYETFDRPGHERRHMMECVCTLIDMQQNRIEQLEKRLSTLSDYNP